MRDTIAILGAHPRTRDKFDFSRDVDVWIFNEAISNKDNTWAKRADAVFQMHAPPIWKNPQNRNDPNHYKWLQTQTEVPVIYMQEQYPEVPASVKYPLEDVRALVKDYHFLSSSVSLAIGLAILRGYKRIEIYGVAMETNTEYQFQREGVAFWYGFALGHGIDCYFADSTFDALIYGYEGEVSIKYENFTERIEQLTPQREYVNNLYPPVHMRLAKAIKDFESECSRENEDELYKALEQARKIAAQLGETEGALFENKRYKEKADAMREHAGDFIFSRQEFEAAAKTCSDKQNEYVTNMNAIGINLASLQKQATQAAKGSKKREQTFGAYRALLDKYMQACHQLSFFRGATNENFSYMAHLDKSIRAAGGSKSEEVLLKQ